MRTHEAVLRRIEADLARGELRIGGRLPPERTLAEQLGVSRASVREAIRVLEAMGVVRSSVGSGPEAGTVVVGDPAAPLSAALRLHLGTRALPIHDLVEARVLLETWAVATAAEAPERAAADLARAEELLVAMDDEALPPERFHYLDAEFHVALAAAAGNVLVTAVMVALREAVHGYVMAAVPALPDWPGTARRLRGEHRELVRAVRAGEAGPAASAVRAHIEGFTAEAGLVVVPG
ncbi:GntR family transcriptional repressor for pyruvate dehydrogenase complex [Kineococcus xinjiangensis]|uniref:GntR family transcriptional repressor for pyruvate dehydrogenase complex n=1 Tax=Kineococcus xinjiangensis TaxID=512762 RepID=A0A2S6IGZ8_9ACTN|nr:FCD domain-containing protein [Kineococcus xinjiangensis]PPK93456.1 GntR family transcriptional repressor for pyruvate dehydrogenase complex [Kineococcus xinjiangensis]